MANIIWNELTLNQALTDTYELAVRAGTHRTASWVDVTKHRENLENTIYASLLEVFNILGLTPLGDDDYYHYEHVMTDEGMTREIPEPQPHQVHAYPWAETVKAGRTDTSYLPEQTTQDTLVLDALTRMGSTNIWIIGYALNKIHLLSELLYELDEKATPSATRESINDDVADIVNILRTLAAATTGAKKEICWTVYKDDTNHTFSAEDLSAALA